MRPDHSRLVPSPLAAAVWERRARRRFAQPDARERARAAVALAGGEPTDAAALRHLEENRFRTEIAFRPWQWGTRWIDGHHLEAAIAQGRGVIASYPHLGPLPGIGVALTRYDPRPCTVVGDWMFNDQADAQARRWRVSLERAGVTPIPSSGSAGTIAAALRSGRTVSIAFDVPGSTPTRFLGHDVLLASGTAWLAQETGALVVPIARGRSGWRPWTRAGAALEPGDGLHDALADVHTRFIRERPAEYENPDRPGWWGAGLTR